MSRNLTTGDSISLGSTHRYQPGEHTKEFILAHQLVGGFLRHASGNERKTEFPEMDADPFDRPSETFDSQVFLDIVVERLSRDSTRVQEQSHFIIDPLLNILQGWGEKYLELDYRNFLVDPSVGHNLGGVLTNPIVIKCLLPPHRNGYPTAGYNAQKMTLVLEGDGQYRGTVGKNAKQCTFVMSNPPFWVGEGTHSSFYVNDVGDSYALRELPEVRLCSHLLDYSLDGIEHNMGIQAGFFKRKNHLYVPDGDGGWTEVQPE